MNNIERKIFKNNFDFNGEVDIWKSNNISYSKDTKVIFAHDSQSLFGTRETWNGQSWDIERIVNEKNIDCIIISAQTPGSRERVNLLSPYPSGELVNIAKIDNEYKKTGGSGALYVRFIVDIIIPSVLKEQNIPLDNKKYIIGSSMGGYINTFALAMYPDVFEGFGIFSPAYWYNLDLIMDKSVKYIKDFDKKIYMDIGTNEGNKEISSYYLNNAKEAAEIIKSNNPNADFKFVVEEDGLHEERAWSKRLEDMIEWFLDVK